MSRVEESSSVASGASWMRITTEVGEPFQVGPDDWDVAVETYVVPDRVRWSRSVDGELRVSAEFGVQEDGRVVCLSVTHHGTPERPVGAGAIRDVRLDAVGREAVIEQALVEQWGRPPTPEETASGNESAAFFHSEEKEIRTKQVAPLQSALRKVGRPATPKGELVQAAAIYKQAGHAPVKAVEDAMGLTPAQATRRVYLARKAGLLPPTTPGRAAR